jgi:protein-tyrosine phosphatase
MVDLHLHLLPGIDDGSPTLDISIAMARMAASDGITHSIATPHASHRYSFDPAVNLERLNELREALAQEAIPLNLATGCDFHISYDNVQDAIEHPKKYTLNGTDYLLIELPDHGLSPNLTETFYELRLAGMIPILTHPERNPTLQKDPSRLADWLRDGMLLQVTTSSVLGNMGKSAQRLAHQLLRDRWVHFLATDAHNIERRPPLMREAMEFVAEKYGEAYAYSLCVANPLAVFEGRALPSQPEALRLYDEDDRIGLPWWKRLLKMKNKPDKDDFDEE